MERERFRSVFEKRSGTRPLPRKVWRIAKRETHQSVANVHSASPLNRVSQGARDLEPAAETVLRSKL